ncbi:MAG: hypothetical protein HQL25_00345 [Candidatus Omnitrophica bacterium]|nr:hypothetical protein [Candidatus Omnitrophota bacterium]
MKKYFLMGNKIFYCVVCTVFLLFFSLTNSSGNSKKINVLFIGNSLTSINDLPGMIAQLAKSRNFEMKYEMYAPGGYTFAQHSADPVLLGKIKRGDWDFVVLQEQSQMPAIENQMVLEAQVYAYAKKLNQMVKAANFNAKVVFYMAMANKNANQERVNSSYTHMAQQNSAMLAPVGIVWKKVRSEKPELNLYLDDRHPSIIGTYLTACVFYATLFKDSPVGLQHSEYIDDKTAVYLQKTIEQCLK